MAFEYYHPMQSTEWNLTVWHNFDLFRNQSVLLCQDLHPFQTVEKELATMKTVHRQVSFFRGGGACHAWVVIIIPHRCPEKAIRNVALLATVFSGEDLIGPNTHAEAVQLL